MPMGSWRAGSGGVEGALAGVGVAAVDVHLLEHDDAAAVLERGHRGGHARAAGADDHHVGLVVDGGGGLEAGLGVLEGLDVGAGLVVAVLEGHEEGEGGQGGTGHGVEVEGLGGQGALGEDLDGGVADVARLGVLAGDARQTAVLEGGLDGHLAVAAVGDGGVDAVGGGAGGLGGLGRAGRGDAGHGGGGGQGGGAGDEGAAGGGEGGVGGLGASGGGGEHGRVSFT